MKNIFRNIAIASVVATGLAVTSCEDMMTMDTGDKAYENAQDTLYSYLGIMRAMQDVAERQVILGEIRGDLVSSSDYTTDTLYAISNFDNPQDQSCSMLKVSDYYNVINNCNFYIHNADTSAVKSNIKYMVPEYAQVKAIRAWAYLQLVKNYREVPFITEPVNSLDVVENFNYAGNLVNKDNLVDRLIADGLVDFADTRYPQYGSTSSTWGAWENGATKVSARLCFIPIRVVLGDLYLLRGASQSDYETAARYYFDYLKNEVTPMAWQYTTADRNPRTGRLSTASIVNSWGSWANTYDYVESTNEVITLIPSSANAGLGKMLTRVADIYGYTPSSQQTSAQSTTTTTDASGNQTTSVNKDANGAEIFEPSGAIFVTPTYKRQYAPSNAFQDVVNQQTYVGVKSVSSVLTLDPIENCDARSLMSTQDVSDDDGEAYPLCAKAARGNSFFYTIPIYRKSLIWLRLAEAINRAGHPEFAFAILKDGLNRFTLPQVTDLTAYTITNIGGTDYYSIRNSETGMVIYKEERNTAGTKYYYDENGDWKTTTTNISTAAWEWDSYTYRGIRYHSGYPLYYVTDTLKIQSFNNFLDFSDNIWDDTYGIHAKGSGGRATIGSTTYTNSDGHTITTIFGTLPGTYYDYGTLLQGKGVDPTTATKADTINAVENLIVDELALETAFEGNRFTDLVRIADHKNAAGYDGTEWLARKIANRGTKAKVGATAAVDGFNADIYSKLKNQSNWYFQMPKWNK